jgi:hypothetical protein
MKMQDLKPANFGGGKKKSNGHKAVCGCPICKNMEKKGGYKIQALEPATIGGKKSNGHKANCGCPICVNMKHQKASKKNRRVTRRHTRRGGDKEDEDEEKEGKNPNDVSYDGDDFNPNPEDENPEDGADAELPNMNLFEDEDDVAGPDDVKPKQPSPVDGGRKRKFVKICERVAVKKVEMNLNQNLKLWAVQEDVDQENREKQEDNVKFINCEI